MKQAGLQADRPVAGELLLQSAQIRDRRGDVGVRQISEGLHERLVVFLQSFLDGFGGFRISEGCLHRGIGVVTSAELGAHLGGTFAIFAMALGTVVIIGRGISRVNGRTKGQQAHCCDEGN